MSVRVRAEVVAAERSNAATIDRGESSAAPTKSEARRAATSLSRRRHPAGKFAPIGLLSFAAVRIDGVCRNAWAIGVARCQSPNCPFWGCRGKRRFRVAVTNSASSGGPENDLA
jgi:hypothetical protein